MHHGLPRLHLFCERGRCSMSDKLWFQLGQHKSSQNRPQSYADLLMGRVKLKVHDTVPNVERIGKIARQNYEQKRLARGEKTASYLFARILDWTDILEKEYPKIDGTAFVITVGTWLYGKMYYKFDQSLFDCLYDSEMKEVPIENLYHLPDWSIYVELPKDNEIFNNCVKGFFATFMHANDTEEAVPIDFLNIIMDTVDRGLLQLAVLPINVYNESNPDVDSLCRLYTSVKCRMNESAFGEIIHTIHYLKYGYESMREFLSIPNNIGPDKNPIQVFVSPDHLNEMVTCCLNLLLYLCGNNSDYHDEINNKIITSPNIQRNTLAPIVASDKTRVITVGKKFGREYSHSLNEWRSHPAGRRPHKRRGHHRKVRIRLHADIPGEYTRKVVWIAPTFVKGYTPTSAQKEEIESVN